MSYYYDEDYPQANDSYYDDPGTTYDEDTYQYEPEYASEEPEYMAEDVYEPDLYFAEDHYIQQEYSENPVCEAEYEASEAIYKAHQYAEQLERIEEEVACIAEEAIRESDRLAHEHEQEQEQHISEAEYEHNLQCAEDICHHQDLSDRQYELDAVNAYHEYNANCLHDKTAPQCHNSSSVDQQMQFAFNPPPPSPPSQDNSPHRSPSSGSLRELSHHQPTCLLSSPSDEDYMNIESLHEDARNGNPAALAYLEDINQYTQLPGAYPINIYTVCQDAWAGDPDAIAFLKEANTHTKATSRGHASEETWPMAPEMPSGVNPNTFIEDARNGDPLAIAYAAAGEAWCEEIGRLEMALQMVSAIVPAEVPAEIATKIPHASSQNLDIIPADVASLLVSPFRDRSLISARTLPYRTSPHYIPPRRTAYPHRKARPRPWPNKNWHPRQPTYKSVVTKNQLAQPPTTSFVSDTTSRPPPWPDQRRQPRKSRTAKPRPRPPRPPPWPDTPSDSDYTTRSVTNNCNAQRRLKSKSRVNTPVKLH